MVGKMLLAGVVAFTALSASAQVTILDSFDTNEGRFGNAVGASGTTAGLVAANSTLTFDATFNHSGTGGSQKIVVDDDPATNVSTTHLWRLRNLSGSPTANGNPANNVALTPDGYIGYWVKTTTAGLQASIIIDDGAESVDERGAFRTIIADGEWHLYEWNFDAAANTDWANFNAGNNVINSATTVSVDAIYILAPGTTPAELDATLWVDDLSYNTAGSLAAVPEPGMLSLAAVGAIGLMTRRRKA